MAIKNTLAGAKIEVVVNGEVHGASISGFDCSVDAVITAAHKKLNAIHEEFNAKDAKN